MGKRSNFKRNKGDYYKTPYEAVLPLLPHLQTQERFCEPCAGDGRLIRHLEKRGHQCVAAWDIEQRGIEQIEIRDATTAQIAGITSFITNPPWTRAILHPIILNLSNQHPCWLLFDADWAHTVQADSLWQRCSMIVAIGRIKWIEGSPFTGKDNCCWYRFDPGHKDGPRFIGRSRT